MFTLGQTGCFSFQLSSCQVKVNESFAFTFRDESDEDNCKMLVMKDNYNKKISPFKFDYVNQMIKPVEVNVSFAVIDVLSTREVDLVYVLKFRFLMEYYDYRLISLEAAS